MPDGKNKISKIGRCQHKFSTVIETFLLSFTHEAEWTPFQTHYFSRNLVAPGNEPGPLDL
jgi:hypothetical protein